MWAPYYISCRHWVICHCFCNYCFRKWGRKRYQGGTYEYSDERKCVIWGPTLKDKNDRMWCIRYPYDTLLHRLYNVRYSCWVYAFIGMWHFVIIVVNFFITKQSSCSGGFFFILSGVNAFMGIWHLICCYST